MSGTWTGFTEEDLKKLKSGSGKGKIAAKKNVNRSIEKIRTFKNNERKLPVVFEVPDAAKLSAPANELESEIKSNIDNNNLVPSDKNKIEVHNDALDIETNNTMEDTSGVELKVNKLDEFEAKQKLIKEQNRKRKELLTKALADRTKKTVEEAQKLKEIKEEFKTLDSLLSNDVSILRYEIECASMDFMEAQKRYGRIEKEFLEAKFLLHNKRERKEMLTEHLCTIIEKNEERKAEKLSELLGKLELDKIDTNSKDEQPIK